VFMILDQEARSQCYTYLTPKEFATIFGGLDVSHQKLYFLEMEETYAIEIFNNMFTDDIANFLTEINSDRDRKSTRLNSSHVSNTLSLHDALPIYVFMILDQEARSQCYTYLTPKEFATIFGGLDVSHQKLYFLEMEETYAIEIFNNMFTDDIANFLTEINSDRAAEILLKMDKEKARKVRGILSHEHETAGSIMTKELI